MPNRHNSALDGLASSTEKMPGIETGLLLPEIGRDQQRFLGPESQSLENLGRGRTRNSGAIQGGGQTLPITSAFVGTSKKRDDEHNLSYSDHNMAKPVNSFRRLTSGQSNTAALA